MNEIFSAKVFMRFYFAFLCDCPPGVYYIEFLKIWHQACDK